MDPLHEVDFFCPPYYENKREFVAYMHSLEYKLREVREDIDRRLAIVEEEYKLKFSQWQEVEA